MIKSFYKIILSDIVGFFGNIIKDDFEQKFVSRFYFDSHWFSDLVFSVGIGYLITSWVEQNSVSSKESIRFEY